MTEHCEIQRILYLCDIVRTLAEAKAPYAFTTDDKKLHFKAQGGYRSVSIRVPFIVIDLERKVILNSNGCQVTEDVSMLAFNRQDTEYRYKDCKLTCSRGFPGAWMKFFSGDIATEALEVLSANSMYFYPTNRSHDKRRFDSKGFTLMFLPFSPPPVSEPAPMVGNATIPPPQPPPHIATFEAISDGAYRICLHFRYAPQAVLNQNTFYISTVDKNMQLHPLESFTDSGSGTFDFTTILELKAGEIIAFYAIVNLTYSPMFGNDDFNLTIA